MNLTWTKPFRLLHTTRTDNILVFDGVVEGLNVSRSMAEEMYRLVPKVAVEVDEVLMPRWLKQRGMK